jgi:hypothetical protein
MTPLITLLLNYYFRAKDYHYDALNSGRLGDHAFFDRLTDGVFDDIDDIQEVINGPTGKFSRATDIVVKKTGTPLELLAAILKELDKQAVAKTATDGTVNLLNSLSQKYQQFYAFLRKYKD